VGHRQGLSQQFRYSVYGTSFLLAKRQSSAYILNNYWHTLPFSSPIENEFFSPGLESVGRDAQSVGKMIIDLLVTVRNVRLHAQQFPQMLKASWFNSGCTASSPSRGHCLTVILSAQPLTR
jgi:hypothetical protein